MRATGAAIAVAALLALWLAGLALPELHLALLYLAPALLLALMLVAGRYPGESVLRRLAELLMHASCRDTPAHVRASRSLRVAPRGGLLLATGLAGRAPPARYA